MKITSLRMVGIRCFEDTGDLAFGERFNLMVGANNAGKSTLLRGIYEYQAQLLSSPDYRDSLKPCWTTITVDRLRATDTSFAIGVDAGVRFFRVHAQDWPRYGDMQVIQVSGGQHAFYSSRPQNAIIPFLARRKTAGFDQNVSAGSQSHLDGTFQHLFSRMDQLATYGHPKHETFKQAIEQTVGLRITMRASQNGKEAGFYLREDTFVTLDRMGDGVTEMVGLITELCLATGKVFILEEPETNLHPRGLKALLKLVRESAAHNQFFIATHSNVVVRELAGEEDSKVFRVFRDGDQPDSTSRVEEVERTPAAHMQLLRELGYDFADFNLHDAWLFLEESSAERFICDILIRWFVPELRGRLRTFAANGVTDVEPCVAAFRRLVVFVHLDPVYEGRIWVRVDGDDPGKAVADGVKAKFPKANVATFEKGQFELYYPARFQDRVIEVLAIADDQKKRREKKALLEDVLDWSLENQTEAKPAWQQSADELITLLKIIHKSL